MKIMAIISPGLVAMMLATTPAVACSAVVVNTPHETIAYTCWAANLSVIPKQEAPIVAPAPVAKPVYHYPPKAKKAKTKRYKKCWYTNKHKKRRWRRC